jgi:hypothetical protein
MASIAGSGSQLAELTTEHPLATVTAPTGGASYQLRVDVNALASISEVLMLKIKTAPRSGDPVRILYQTIVAGVQGDPIKDSPVAHVPAAVDIVVTLQQDGGTGRAYPWALYRLDG